mmetsp:Transcript_18832/g.59203  ORF Transcript_18832/g.59203 Transcript_18832/m.59203 type:complete len:130 (+) Transcript_18832:28-417(+)
MSDKKELKEYTAEEVAKHSKETDIWLIIDGLVYDVTKFLPEHPGGEEVIIEHAGMEASEAFEDIGHSTDARNMLKDYLVGKLKGAPLKKTKGSSSSGSSGKPPAGGSFFNVLVPVFIAAAIYFYVSYVK